MGNSGDLPPSLVGDCAVFAFVEIVFDFSSFLGHSLADLTGASQRSNGVSKLLFESIFFEESILSALLTDCGAVFLERAVSPCTCKRQFTFALKALKKCTSSMCSSECLTSPRESFQSTLAEEPVLTLESRLPCFLDEFLLQSSANTLAEECTAGKSVLLILLARTDGRDLLTDVREVGGSLTITALDCFALKHEEH